MLEFLQYDFIQNAFLAGFLASIICGIIGTLVVINRLVFLAGGVAHASYGGVGLAFCLGLPVLPVATGFSTMAAMLMAWITLSIKERADTVIGVMWAAGMAFGIILLDLTPGYNVDLMSYLFGSILTVGINDIYAMCVVALAVATLTALFYKGFLLSAFDEDFARSRGIPVTGLYFLLLAMVAVSVVMIIQVVGLILIIALLTIPPFIAGRFSRSMGWMMIWSSVLSFIFCTLGLFISFQYDITSGAAIIAVAATVFGLSFLVPETAN